MLKLNIVPKARKLSDEIQYEKKPFRKNPFLHNRGIFTTAAFLVAFVAAYMGKMTLFGICFGLSFVGTTLLTTKNNSNKIKATFSWIFAVLGILIIGGMLNRILGAYIFVPVNFMAVILFVIFIRNILMPLPVHFFFKKRAERCTESVMACLNDGSSNLDSVDNLSSDKVFDLGKSPYANENFTMVDNAEREFYDKHGIEYNHTVFVLCNCSPTDGYEYIYSYEGNRYALNLSTAKKDKYAEQYGKELPVYIDPEKPENYYCPLFMPLNLSNVIVKMFFFAVFFAFSLYILIKNYGLFT